MDGCQSERNIKKSIDTLGRNCSGVFLFVRKGSVDWGGMQSSL